MAAEFGLTPTQTDALSIGELAVMQVAAVRRKRERLEHTGALLDGLLNYGGMRGKDFKPVAFGRHYRAFLGLPETEGTGAEPDRIDMEEFRKRVPADWFAEA